MKYFITLCCCCLFSVLAAEDHIVLSDGQRIDGKILSASDDVIVIRLSNDRVQKYPRKIITTLKYKDGSNWALLENLLREQQYHRVVGQLQKDAKKHPQGGSYRQVQNMVYCLRQLNYEKQLVEWCHEVCRHQRDDVLKIIDLFVAIDPSDKFAEREKHWLHCLKYSRYKLGRRRCALVLAIIYKVNDIDQNKIDALLKKHQVDKEQDLRDLVSFVKGHDQTKLGEAIKKTDFYHAIKVRQLVKDGPADDAALAALRVGLDENVDVVKRVGFLHLAAEALQKHAPKEAEIIKQLSNHLQRVKR